MLEINIKLLDMLTEVLLKVKVVKQEAVKALNNHSLG